MIGLINAAYAKKMFPELWKVIPVTPIPKPRKNGSRFESTRPIYLLAGIMKLYDKMLHARISKKVKEAVQPWQAGGAMGAIKLRGC